MQQSALIVPLKVVDAWFDVRDLTYNFSVQNAEGVVTEHKYPTTARIQPKKVEEPANE